MTSDEDKSGNEDPAEGVQLMEVELRQGVNDQHGQSHPSNQEVKHDVQMDSEQSDEEDMEVDATVVNGQHEDIHSSNQGQQEQGQHAPEQPSQETVHAMEANGQGLPSAGNTYSLGSQALCGQNTPQIQPNELLTTMVPTTTNGFEETPQLGYTLQGKRLQQCTEPSTVHWPIVAPAVRMLLAQNIQSRYTDRGLPLKQCTEPN